MNLTKLFELQAQLDADIETKHPAQEGEDRFGKKVLALLVELGELGQCWRGFKYWSKDQQARTKVDIECSLCSGTGDVNYEMVQEDAEGNGGHEYIHCEECDGTGYDGECNPLLEEYVDCLHFLLSIGNDVFGGLNGTQIREVLCDTEESDETVNIEATFIVLFSCVPELLSSEYFRYRNAITIFLSLGLQLGFTWEQIEQAYYDKNKENFARQARGY